MAEATVSASFESPSSFPGMPRRKRLSEMRQKPRGEEQGGTFRILVGDHIDDCPSGCQCESAQNTDERQRGKNHRYEEGDLIESPKRDLVARFNQGTFSRKFERVQSAAPPAPPPTPTGDKLLLSQLVAIAEEEEIDLKGASKRDDILKVLRAAGAVK